MINNNNPCYHCTDRFVGCHSVCDLYLKWDAENRAFNEKQRRERGIRNALDEAAINRYKKRRK